MEPVEILRHARDAVLTGPEKWTKGAFYRDANGDPLSALQSELAEEFGTVGAICYSALALGMQEWVGWAVGVVGAHVPGHSIHRWNDLPPTTYPDVIDLLDLAIKTEEERDQ